MLRHLFLLPIFVDI